MAHLRRLGLILVPSAMLAAPSGCGQKGSSTSDPTGRDQKPSGEVVASAPVDTRELAPIADAGLSPRDQVASYAAAYATFSEDLRTRVLAIKARGPKTATLPQDVTAVLDWAMAWTNVHPAPAKMGPPLQQGEFPDREGLRPNPNFAFQHADVDAMLDQLHKVMQGDLTALFHN